MKTPAQINHFKPLVVFTAKDRWTRTALTASHRCTTHCGGRVRKTELVQVAVSVLQRPFVITDSSVSLPHSVTVALVRMTLN